MSIWSWERRSRMDSGLPVKRTIADQVAELVRQRILTGQLKGGQPIRQEHLAAEFGVSRIPLREALKQLAAEGFVTITSHKGAVVAELSIAEVEELFDIRLKLEAWLLQLAISAMTDRDLVALEKNMEEQRKPDVLPRWGDVNWRFHEIMYLPAGRPITLKLLKNIHDKIDRYLRLEVTMRSGFDRALREHDSLIAFCRSRDVPAAVSLLERHIRETARGLIASLKMQ
ncbi:MAG: GntR family transcriptional regulator [Rhodospirillum sp.]|nr:GntR family transcriptional regulator [Rhodospirillum sp.]